ncbi:MAG: WecB/TagA/CpsF family glycosyltransferase [Pseudoruegeria sp.]
MSFDNIEFFIFGILGNSVMRKDLRADILNEKHVEPSTVCVGGFNTIVVDSLQLADTMLRDCIANRRKEEESKLVFSSNGQGVSLAGTNPDFMKTMEQAHIIHADGMSVVWASRILASKPLPSRVATSDFFYDAAEVAQANGLSFYMFGGSELQNSTAVQAIKKKFPNLKIVGRRHGYFCEQDDEDICREIVESGADVLWVGLGKPLQEEWCVRNKKKLKGIGWIKTCGGLYGFLGGTSRRAPGWLQHIGFEWAFRAALNPRHLLLRYLITNPHAIYRMVRYTKR